MMLTFELSAIDMILSISVVILFIFVVSKRETKYSNEKSFLKKVKKLNKEKQKETKIQSDTEFVECPRGFGNIRLIGVDNSVSDRCLSCYRLTECYSKNKS